MEEGYYIPDITEFHVGFEYELIPSRGFIVVNFEDPNEKTETLWATDYEKGIFGIKDVEPYGSALASISSGIREGKCRVKYLDKEDIEELGWYFTKLHPGTSSHEFEFDKYNLDFDPHFNDKWNLRIYDGEDCDNEFNYFSGFVRNKSELSKLMKRLNISKE